MSHYFYVVFDRHDRRHSEVATERQALAVARRIGGSYCRYRH